MSQLICQTETGTDTYLTTQLIAYLGNKRRLLPFLSGLFDSLDSGFRPLSFADPFCGSGSVSRLARSKGWQVSAGDWEFYAYIINTAYLCMGPSDAQALMEPYGGFETLAASFDDVEFEPYISKHFAPAETRLADFRSQRLFYSAENAKTIDRIRTGIENLWPGWNLCREDFLRKCLMLGPLLYEAATSANTSGVFKSYHKGFGGYAKDALDRILKPIKLHAPLLIEGAAGQVYHDEAETFIRGKSFDLVYLDPPYNCHQYGSNYFMLNSIALWDKPHVDNSRRSDGSFQKKAGIREDWITTRSPYCYKRSAIPVFDRLLQSIDSRHIVISYNSEGIIEFEQMYDMGARYGKVSLYGADYTKYRGGKQSLKRLKDNVEFALVIDRSSFSILADKGSFTAFLERKKLSAYLRSGFDIHALRAAFPGSKKSIEIGGIKLEITPKATLELKTDELPDEKQCSELREILAPYMFRDRKKASLYFLAEYGRTGRHQHKKLCFVNLKKLAYRKYKHDFNVIVQEIRKNHPEFEETKEMRKLLAVFGMRMANRPDLMSDKS